MSDSPAAFRAKTEAMCDKAVNQLWSIAHHFVFNLAAELIDNTPGPNLQLPETEYIATGRLRGGWSFDTTQRAVASRWDGGPYTEHGEDTHAEVVAAVVAAGRFRTGYLQNDVAYGYIVHEGRGRMPIDRPWVTTASKNAGHHAAAARAEVMGGGR